MGERTRRSPADVLRFVVAAIVVLALLLVEWLAGDTLVTFASDLFGGLDAIPSWMSELVVVSTRLLGVVVVGSGLLWALHGRHWRTLITVVTAGLLAVAILAGLDSLVETDAGIDLFETSTSLGPLTTDDFVSTADLAAAAGGLTAAAPWMRRRWRRAGWLLGLGLTITTFVQAPISFDAALALATGWLCGAAVLVVGGAPSRRPMLPAVIDGLRAVGLPVHRLDPASVDARGSVPYYGVTDDGRKLFVKALGTDERSADLLFRLYRGLQPHNFGDERPFGSLRRGVEHEAFVALSASALGVRTPMLRAFATAAPNGYVLAYEAIEGKSLDRVDPSEVSDAVLEAVWDLVGQLRHHRIAHRDLRLANLFLDDAGKVWLIDFGFSEMAASDLLLATDVAELLASSSTCVGPQRAIAKATRAVDPCTLAQASDRLRMWVLSGATRAALRTQPGLLETLRSQLADAVAETTRCP